MATSNSPVLSAARWTHLVTPPALPLGPLLKGSVLVCEDRHDKNHRLCSFNNRSLLSHSPRGWKPKVRWLAGGILLRDEGGRGTIHPVPLPDLPALPTASGMPQLVDAPSYPCPSSRGLLSLCVSPPFKDTVILD